jgi:hypothetical protein
MGGTRGISAGSGRGREVRGEEDDQRADQRTRKEGRSQKEGVNSPNSLSTFLMMALLGT